MFGIGGWELIVIAAVALLVLGPKRLPAAARSVGKGLQTLRRATIDLRRSIELDPEMEDLPRSLDEIGRPIITATNPPRARSRPRLDQDFDPPPPPVAVPSEERATAPKPAPVPEVVKSSPRRSPEPETAAAKPEEAGEAREPAATPKTQGVAAHNGHDDPGDQRP